MHKGFAYEMQKEAERLAKPFEGRIYGVKCWYSAARLFDQKAERVFVATNPGGGNADEKREDKSDPYTKHDFNAWLCEDWSGRGSEHQKRVLTVFKILYGTTGREVLRETPCFNVAPFRTPSSKELPECAWESALDWFTQVIEHLQPKTIICNGNGEGKSPWGALCSKYSINNVKKVTLTQTSSLKEGVVASGSLAGAKILAFPHLTGAIRNPDRLYEELEKRSPIYRSLNA